MNRLEVTGNLQLCTQEGGYADDAIEIENISLAELIKEHLTKTDESKWGAIVSFGRVRIVIEQIEVAK